MAYLINEVHRLERKRVLFLEPYKFEDDIKDIYCLILEIKVTNWIEKTIALTTSNLNSWSKPTFQFKYLLSIFANNLYKNLSKDFE